MKNINIEERLNSDVDRKLNFDRDLMKFSAIYLSPYMKLFIQNNTFNGIGSLDHILEQEIEQ